MLSYITRRVLLMLITLFGISLVSFIIINLAPGSPIEQRLQAIRSGAGGRGDATVSNEVIEAMKRQYGFDKPIYARYGIWVRNLARLDFGESFTYQEPVLKVIVSKLPVSLQFGLVSFLLTYLICIPLGIAKGRREGSLFDASSSFVLFVLYSIPSVVIAILLITFFAGGSFLNWFPLGGIHSDQYFDKEIWGQIGDRIYHFVLPLICYTLSNFTLLTLLMKDSIVDEIRLDYIRTARAKGLPEDQVYYKHALRNALIPIATGFGSFLSIFFSGSIIIETIFQLDGMGLLSYNAILQRDYNVIMGLIALQSLFLLAGRLLSDVLYVLIDPRIDFA